MKKRYLTACLLSIFTIGIHAQNPILTAAPQSVETSFVTTPVTAPPTTSELIPKVGGEIIWSNDFSNPSSWTINNSGQSNANFGWNINPTVESWYSMGIINSISGGNFAEVKNGNPTLSTPTQALNVTYTLSTASPIAISTRFLELSFNQYGARFNDAQEMYISTNGTTWTKVGDNSGIDALTDQGGALYPNPSSKLINLAPFISAGTSQLWIRFSWTTAIPTQASNPNVWITYGWMIDDVKLTELYPNDLRLNDVVWGVADGTNIVPYYKTPINQIQPIKFGGIIANDGTLNKTDVVFKANITSAGYAGQSVASSINAPQIDTIFVANTFTPPNTVGSYSANGFTVQTAVDDFSANNSLSAPINFEITEYLYARDKGVLDGVYRSQSQEFELCNYFKLYTNQTARAVDVFIHQTSTTNAEIEVSIRSSSNLSTILVGSSEHDLIPSNLNTFVTVPLSNSYVLTAGEYLVCVASNATANVVIGNSGYSDTGSSLLYLESTAEWYYTNKTPMVRLRLGPECMPVTSNNPRIICQGQSYTINGHTYTTAGTYTDIMQSVGGCDSTVTTFLTVKQPYMISSPRTICQGQSYVINGHTYTAAGTYTDVMQSIHGCDSTVTTILTVTPAYSTSNPQSICTGGSYSINGNTYTVPGTYTDLLHATNGCDSIVTTIITIGTPSLNTAASISGITLTSLENNATYQWVDCNNNNIHIGGATSQSFTPTSNGSYAVILTSTTSCPGATATSPCYNISHVGMNDIDKVNGIKLYPNPAREEVFITSENAEMKYIRLTDLNGKQFHQEQFSGKEIQLNLRNLSQGIYLLEIETDNVISVERFVKE